MWHNFHVISWVQSNPSVFTSFTPTLLVFVFQLLENVTWNGPSASLRHRQPFSYPFWNWVRRFLPLRSHTTPWQELPALRCPPTRRSHPIPLRRTDLRHLLCSIHSWNTPCNFARTRNCEIYVIVEALLAGLSTFSATAGLTTSFFCTGGVLFTLTAVTVVLPFNDLLLDEYSYGKFRPIKFCPLVVKKIVHQLQNK